MAGVAELQILIKARDEASGILGNITKSAATLGLAFAGAAVLAVKAAAEEEVGMKQLAQAARNAGVDWDKFGATTEKQITAWQTLSSVADTEIRPAFALLIAQTGSLEEATKRMPIALDLSRGANIDLATASRLLGKLTDENVNVFKRMGLTFDKNATQAEVLEAVQKKFAGQSSEYAKTAAGAWEGFQNDFKDVMESIGVVLLPMLKTAIGGIRDFLKSFSEGGGLAGVKDAFLTIAGVIGEVFDVLTGRAPDAGAVLTKAIGPEAARTIMDAVATIREGFKTAFAFIQENVLPPLMTAFKFLQDNWKDVAFAIKVVALTVLVPAFVAWAVAAGTAALATIIALAPVILAMTAIGVAAFLLHKAWTENFGDIQGKTHAVVNFLLDLFDGFKLFVLNVWRGILVGISNAVNGIIGVVNGFIEGYNALADKLGLPLLGTISLITPNLDSIDAAINQVARDRASRITVITDYLTTGSPRGIPQAAGGDYMVTSPTLFLAGEAGPERATFTPQGRGGSGGGVTVIFQGPVYGMQDLEQKIKAIVRDTRLAGGFRGV